MSELYEPAGDFAVVEENREKDNWIIRFDDNGLGRRCGACQLCCRLLPVPRPLAKPANTRCVYQRHGKGCAIYANRPPCCRAFSCRWMSDPRAHDLRRPDHAHYVVDITPDHVILSDNETGKQHKIGVIQVWVDPAHRDAHRDPRLRAYLATMAEELGYAALVRFNEHDSLALFPPALSADGQWHERGDSDPNTRVVPETEMHPELVGVVMED